MRNTIAVLAVAFYGFSWAITGLSAIAAPLYLVFLILGIALIVFRRPIAAWIVRGAESDTGVLALAAVRGIGLLFLFSATRTIVEIVQLTIPTGGELIPRETWLPLSGAVVLAQIAAAIVLLARPAAIAGVLDSVADESPQAVQIQTVVFGAIALWVLIDDVPSFLSALVQIWKEVRSGDMAMQAGSLFWALRFPEALASLVRIIIALWIFFGRERLARAWHRLRPMTAE